MNVLDCVGQREVDADECDVMKESNHDVIPIDVVVVVVIQRRDRGDVKKKLEGQLKLR
jgi:hypothetical protein